MKTEQMKTVLIEIQARHNPRVTSSKRLVVTPVHRSHTLFEMRFSTGTTIGSKSRQRTATLSMHAGSRCPRLADGKPETPHNRPSCTLGQKLESDMSETENVGQGADKRELARRLREVTSAGIRDCVDALAKAGGDFDRAVEILRVKGLAIIIRERK